MKIIRAIPAIILIIALTLPAFGETATFEASKVKQEKPEKKTGSLHVYSKIGVVEIYLDKSYMGETPIELDDVKIGAHRLEGKKGPVLVYKDNVTIKEGEIFSVLITEEMDDEDEDDEDEEGEDEDKKEARENARNQHNRYRYFYYGRSGSSGGASGYQNDNLFFQSLYGKIGYISSYNYSYAPDIYDFYYGSSFIYSVGYGLSFTPYASILFEIGRADFSSPDASWYLIPMSINLKIGYPIASGFSGMYYYSLGLGYYETNLEYQGSNLSALGFNLASGMEIPIGLSGSFFLESSYGIAENSKAEFALDTLTFTIGYRMNIW